MVNTPFLDAVRKGIRKASDPKEKERLGFEPEQVQALLQVVLNDSNRFIALRMAALIIVLYWGTARFEEAAALTLENVSKRGLTYRIVVKKVKQTRSSNLRLCTGGFRHC